MNSALLIDIGSTYTKVTAVDLENCNLLGTAASYTTIQTDVSFGLENALKKLFNITGELSFSKKLACSSAAGGLKMVTCGLVPSLTSEAAKRASLGAGAKVLKVFSYELTEDDLEEIETLSPDILLLTGGTDGGNSQCILKNAEVLANIKGNFPVVVAGNRNAAKKCKALLEGGGKEVYVCENVMPVFNELNVAPVQEVIREIFLKRIIDAKGLTELAKTLDAPIIPTPSALLNAVKLLADGTEGEGGIGELLAVDLGGATTDIYSIGEGLPQTETTVLRGLPEVYAKRTVEGDIGMRYSAHGIVEAAGGIEAVAKYAGLTETEVSDCLHLVTLDTEKLPDTDTLFKFDHALASLAIKTAVDRHVGTIEQIFTPMGTAYLQTGKDLRSVTKVVATGGAIIHAQETKKILEAALYSEKESGILKPKTADFFVDTKYIMAAMGLLSQADEKTALRILKKELTLSGR